MEKNNTDKKQLFDIKNVNRLTCKDKAPIKALKEISNCSEEIKNDPKN